MTVADFPLKLGLVLRTLNLSRGHLAQLVKIDKSAVSRWASGVQGPTEHNLSLLTGAVARYWPGFTQQDWNLDLKSFGNQLTSLCTRPSSQEKPSIAVLPFQNLSDGVEQEYFVDGLAEEIITGMSRFNSLFVIARNSSFTYKGKPTNAEQIGRELGVRYILQGSVRRAGGRLRITVQLINAPGA
jgi:TolB-like protein